MAGLERGNLVALSYSDQEIVDGLGRRVNRQELVAGFSGVVALATLAVGLHRAKVSSPGSSELLATGVLTGLTSIYNYLASRETLAVSELAQDLAESGMGIIPALWRDWGY